MGYDIISKYIGFHVDSSGMFWWWWWCVCVCVCVGDEMGRSSVPEW